MRLGILITTYALVALSWWLDVTRCAACRRSLSPLRVGPLCEPCACDGAWTAGNIGVPSGTAAGKIHDSASATPPASGSYVLFLDTGGSAGNARCLLLKTL